MFLILLLKKGPYGSEELVSAGGPFVSRLKFFCNDFYFLLTNNPYNNRMPF